jgi:signal transduction histidine kinase
LTGIEYMTQTLAGRLRLVSKSASVKAEEIASMVRRATTHARELAHGLSPIGLEADGLMVGLKQLAARTKQIFRIDCRFRCSPAVFIHDPEVGAHLYRIAQEAVSNAIKHGKARRIDIGLVLNGERVVLAVSDNGIGMPKRPRKRTGMGLRVMQYRAGVIGGSLVVQRQPDGGTTFVCVVKGVHADPKKKK